MATRQYTRNGCKTCKARRLKCDEAQPACKRCIKTGRTCEGYAIARSMNNQLFVDEKELQSYQYFCEETRPMLAGHYNQDFWDHLVVQIAVSNEAIRHALAAVGSLHGSWNSTLSREPSQFSLQQCNKSIQLLLNSQMSLVPSLVACILFACFNLFQNHLDSGLMHLQSGLKILRNWLASDKSCNPRTDEDAMVASHFIPIYANYEAVLGSAAEDPSSDTSVLSYARQIRQSQPRPSPSDAFTSLHQARTYFHALLDTTFSDLESAVHASQPEIIAQIIDFGQADLRTWYRRLLVYLNCIARSQSPEFVRAASLLRVQHLVSTITLATAAYADEMLFDAFTSEFRQIIDLCAEVVKLENHTETGKLRVSLSFDNGIITAISLVIMRCRDPNVRRKAMRLCEGVHRQEGILGTGASVATWRLVVWIEEFGIRPPPTKCSHIPRGRRVRVRSVDYEPGQFSRGGHGTGPPRWMFRWTCGEGQVEGGEVIDASFPFPVTNAKGDAFGDFKQGFELRYGLDARVQEMAVACRVRWDGSRNSTEGGKGREVGV